MLASNASRFRIEREMRAPVVAWLLARGYFAAVEFNLHGGGVTDIVAGAYARRTGRQVPKLLEVVAVELKLHDIAGVLRQARWNMRRSDWSYAAMPEERIAKMRDVTLEAFRANGIGVLSVGDEATEIIAPRPGDGLPSHLRQVKTLWRRVGTAVKDWPFNAHVTPTPTSSDADTSR